MRNMRERLRQVVSDHEERPDAYVRQFRCAIHALAPNCTVCGIRIIGHGLEKDGTFCCDHCAERAGINDLRDRV
jgi:hypothetical protein